MEVWVLGSGGYLPFPDAGMPAVLARRGGRVYLFDAGEDTQTRMVRAGVSRADLEAVFISHMHGDHVLGLPGVLLRRSQEGGTERPLELYGPSPLERFVAAVGETLDYELSYPVRFHRLTSGERYDRTTLRVRVLELDHRTETYGFYVEAIRRKRQFDPGRARFLEVPEGPLWNRLQHGETVTLEDGRTVRPEQVSDPPPEGPSFAYLPDTRPLEDYPEAFREPDLLIHEAMFLHRDRDHAASKGHSTAREAAEVARRLGAKQLVLTHFSRRYDDPSVLAEEAREVFSGARRATDGMKIELP